MLYKDGDVWSFETDAEEMAAEELSSVCNQALEGNSFAQNYLTNLWDGESWESIKEKLLTEGSVWYVWWMDGVSAYLCKH